MFSALIIDLKQSRRYPVKDREAIQRFIYRVCGTLNDVFRPGVERYADFSAGDEIQGLFNSPSAAYMYYRLFSMLIHPVKIRAGIGVGTWDIQIENAGTTAQDGQVYHKARKAIQNADELEGYTVLYCSGKRSDAVINSLIGGAAGIGSRMNDYQNELMLLAELVSPIDADHILDTGSIYRVAGLAAEKSRIEFFSADRRGDRRYPFDGMVDMRYFDEAIPVDVTEIGDSFFITSGKQRGLSLKMANMLGITRQSVDKTLKTANVFVARNMTISAIQVMLDDH